MHRGCTLNWSPSTSRRNGFADDRVRIAERASGNGAPAPPMPAGGLPLSPLSLSPFPRPSVGILGWRWRRRPLALRQTRALGRVRAKKANTLVGRVEGKLRITPRKMQTERAKSPGHAPKLTHTTPL